MPKPIDQRGHQDRRGELERDQHGLQGEVDDRRCRSWLPTRVIALDEGVTIRPQPSTRTKSRSLNGSETDDRRQHHHAQRHQRRRHDQVDDQERDEDHEADDRTPTRSSDRTNAGISVVSATSTGSAGFGMSPAPRHQRELLAPGLRQHELAQRLDAVGQGLRLRSCRRSGRAGRPSLLTCVSTGPMTNRLRNSASPASTWFGGIVLQAERVAGQRRAPRRSW